MNVPPAVAPVTALPGYGEVKTRQLAGYLPVSAANDAYIYVWYIESAGGSPDDPIVIWLNGGPGSSSFIGLFAENGPYRIQADGTLVDNAYSWHRKAAYLMIDQPPGTGLSVVESSDAWARTEEEATQQLLWGLMGFFEQFPELRRRELYVFGESFAGVYVPMLARAILTSNDAGRSQITLAGIGVGDGWVYPEAQQATYGRFAYAHGLLDTHDGREVERLYAACAEAIHKTYPSSRHADRVCNRIEQYISKVSGGTNVYDVRVIGDYDFSPIGRYLDQPAVRAALRVAADAPAWTDTAKRVGHLLEKGEQDSVADLYPMLFERLRVLIYNGIYDMDCNFIGTDEWVENLQWSHRGEFLEAGRAPWLVDGHRAGYIRAAGNLTQVIVAGAGHLVPMDQPQSALALFAAFVSGTLTMPPPAPVSTGSDALLTNLHSQTYISE